MNNKQNIIDCASSLLSVEKNLRAAKSYLHYAKQNVLSKEKTVADYEKLLADVLAKLRAYCAAADEVSK